MEHWKIVNKSDSGRSGSKKKGWITRALAIVMIVATLAAAVYDFPAIWNQTASFAQEKTGVDVPRMQEEPFKLGLDLQGGTHLVYDADMSEIPEEDRVSALAGVRDVIERRVNAFGVSEPLVQTTINDGNYRIIVELAGIKDTNAAIEQIGETPVLEFKEPGQSAQREPTEEEQQQLEDTQTQQREAAQEVLDQALAGEDFDALVTEHSVGNTDGETPGRVTGLSKEVPLYEPIVTAIEENNVVEGQIVPEVVENPEGLNIVKNLGENQSKEMLLSHILICYEGTTGCENPIPEIEAATKISQLKDEATPENFADLAEEHSTDKGLGGGDLGWVGPGETVTQFQAAAASLDVGEISGTVKTEFGFHLIHKRDQRDTQTQTIQRVLMPLDDVNDVVPTSPWKNTELSGKYLEDANVQFDQNTGEPYVALQFDQKGGELFGQLTSEHVGEPIAIFLDGRPISTPRVQQAIYGGQAVITGQFTVEEARTLAQRLRAGALPVPIDLLSQQTVGPTLGDISLNKSITAVLYGFAAVALFMIAAYRLPGLLATLALIFYAFLNLAAYRLFGVTITLAGIAGFVLSVGIAVDANVLIIERFREEFMAGRDFKSAIDVGFKRAWTAIRDGNLTTLIAAAVLYGFSSSFIKGFALTLSIGVLLSMFTAILVTRVYIKNVLDWKALRKPWMYGVKTNKEKQSK